jgi:hypothetical protein
VEFCPRKPGPWCPWHILSVPIYQGKIYSQYVFEVYAIKFFLLFPAYSNPHVVPYSHAMPKVRIELLRCVSAQDLCFAGRKGPVF